MKIPGDEDKTEKFIEKMLNLGVMLRHFSSLWTQDPPLEALSQLIRLVAVDPEEKC